MDSLSRQRNFSEVHKITNFSKILLKFAIIFKNFEYFCPLLILTILTGQQNFLCHSVALRDRSPETKNLWTLFPLQNLETSFLNFALLFFLYDLVTNKARKLDLQSPISSQKYS